MSHTLAYHSIQDVQLCYHHVRKGIRPDAPAPAWAHAYAHTPTQVDAHANATTPHLQYCAAGSTSVICKMTILQRQGPFMDDLVRSNPPSTSRLAEGPL
ncbi:hypothetical protein O181_102228 [Austropuccinia psidii MF-1]|uniref:Uncharacterized protein n=1 Tax=Austropuccinia psidii MF-1 TaxID=1389203 RepID=A0A9Q3JI11_9BASI|nr:hypothetical protein [Austropuccinia psidii MF-1]